MNKTGLSAGALTPKTRRPRRRPGLHLAAAALLMGALPMTATAESAGSIGLGAPPAAATTGAFAADPVLPPEAIYLEADQMEKYDKTNSYVAKGDVFARYDQRSIRARQVTYDPETGVVLAEGDVAILNDDGSTQFADTVELDDKLSAGVAQNFSYRMAGQGTLAADVAIRKSEKVNELHQAVYSACDACTPEGEAKTPTWALKATEVVENRDAKVVVYKHARLEAVGVPVFYTPILWHPDPTVDRASGFLVPEFGVSSKRGAFLETPYLWAISPHQDLTISPQFNEKVAPMMNLRWRKRFYSGQVDIRGGITHEQEFDGDGNLYGEESTRSYVLGEGEFRVNQHWRWGFGLEQATDDLLPKRYDISDLEQKRGLIQSDEQRFLSQIYAEGGDYNWHSRVLVGDTQGLRAGDDDETFAQPLPIFEAFRTFPGVFGGQAELKLSGAHLQRGMGTQSSRVSAAGQWQRVMLTDAGVKVAPFAYGRGDVYRLHDLPAAVSVTGDEDVTRLVGAVGTDISMPFIKLLKSGAVILEPVTQVVVATEEIDDANLIPNEDSQSFELDASNLMSISRTPGYDVWEGGQRLNAGLKARYETGRVQVHGFAGRSWRNNGQLLSAGLEDDNSDWVGELGASYAGMVGVKHQFRLDEDGLDDRRLDTLFWGRAGQASVWGRHVRVTTATNINAFEELSLGAQWTPKRFWGARAEITQDLQNDVTRRGQIGLLYRDECTELEIAYVREDQADRTLGPSDSISIRFALATLGEFGDR